MKTEYLDEDGSGFTQVGVKFHGEDETIGSWIDQTSSANFQIDQYSFGEQNLAVTSDIQEDKFVLSIKVKEDLIHKGVGLEADEIFIAWRLMPIRLQFCGDNNECFTSPDIPLKVSCDSK